MEAETERLALLFQPLLRDQINEAGQAAMLIVSPGSFNGSDPAVLDFVLNRTKLVAGSINEETDKQLRSELAQGLSNGESINEIRARIESVYGAAAGYRAERIARTETIKAETFSAIEAWVQSDEVAGKEWYTARDERVCSYCSPMNGKTIGLTKTFYKKGSSMTTPQLDANGNPVVDADGNEKLVTIKFDYEDIDGPPLHSNCRCVLLPILKDA
jgi:SPP1 gp7 family putative phage head morphogenesis protein